MGKLNKFDTHQAPRGVSRDGSCVTNLHGELDSLQSGDFKGRFSDLARRRGVSSMDGERESGIGDVSQGDALPSTSRQWTHMSHTHSPSGRTSIP